MDIVSFLLGITVVQILYLLFYYLFLRRREFLYYLLFILGIYSFIAIKFLPGSSRIVWSSATDYVVPGGYGILILSMSMYYRFVRHYIQAPAKYPFFNRWIRINEQVVIGTGLVMMTGTILQIGLGVVKYFALLVYLANMVIQVYVFYFLIRTRNPVNYILVAGTIIASIMFKRSVVVDAFAFGESGLLREDLQFILMAMVVDMLVINFAMVYNSRLIERAAIQAQMDRERALYQQREDIGNDLHDDIGATMSSIQVYAGMAQKAMRQASDPTQLEDLMKRVSSGVKSVSESINDVVWATSARAREGKSLSSRIKDFYVDVFDTSGIECTYDIDPDAEAGITDMLARKNLLMIAKEAINNAVKHSGAKRLKVSLRRENDKLRLFVEDDGKGLPETLSSLGNGFHSMSQRARRLGGDLRLSPTVDGGTRVECEIPMTRISD